MFNQGLSLDQAPPISVPFRFFITAPIFAILIGVAFLFFPLEIVGNRYSHITIGLVHLFTLGVLSMIIFGAMQQMMPVLAGAVIPRAKLFATVIHSALSLGTLLFAASFIFELRFLMHAALSLLILAFGLFFIVTTKLLFQVKFLTPTVNVMRLFSITGFLTAIFGVIVTYNHMILEIPSSHYFFVNTHITLGAFGFAVLLIMGVAFQVIPMFYVAKEFSSFIQNRMPFMVFALIFMFAGFFMLESNIYVLKLLMTALLITFCLKALDALNNRRRPVFDVTLWYWKTALYFFIFSMLNWLFVPQDSPFLLTIMFAFGFLYSLLQGMVYKIIPFLSWFHLSSKGYFTIPTMREMISEDMIKLHYYMHMVSIAFFMLAPLLSNLFLIIGAGFFIASNILFLANCSVAVFKYRKIAKTDPMQIS